MPDRYAKTDVGRAEIRARVHALTRTARNLLLIIDPSRDASHWLSMVQGATAADLQTLVDAGLIAAPDAAPPKLATPTPPLAAPPAAEQAAGVAATLSYAELYALLPSLGKEHLGLIKGFRFALAVEKADGLAGLQQVARDLLAEIERTKGPAVARSVQRALLLP